MTKYTGNSMMLSIYIILVIGEHHSIPVFVTLRNRKKYSDLSHSASRQAIGEKKEKIFSLWFSISFLLYGCFL